MHSSSTSSFIGLAILALAALGPIALIACTNDDSSADSSGDPSEDDIKKTKLADEGSACTSTKACKTGLVCKAKPTSSGPPPGALGMPVPSSTSTHNGPPPGALGMPLPPSETCQKPAPGEEGGSCSSSQKCDPGLECEYSGGGGSSSSSTGGMPPGALGMPIPSSTSTSGHPVLGMPIQRQGTCAPSGGSSTSGSGGPPPGALGMPVHS